MTLDKFLDDIDAADLRQLIEGKVSGPKEVEYKKCLPDDSYESQKEFLADVSSFANTLGGHLLYGVQEENGVPVARPGISGMDLDCEILRLETLLRDHIQPRIPAIAMRVVEERAENPVLIVRVPQSWSKPHVVDFQGHWRFYARTSTGKYPLGPTELKSAFLATAGLGERIRSFQFERLSKIFSGRTPISLLGKARTVFHLIPYSAFESDSSLRLTAIEDIWSIPLMDASASSYRYNLDGLIVHRENEERGCSAGYTQVFRNAIVESVSVGMLGSGVHGPYVPSATFETDLTAYLDACIALYQRLSVSMPAVLLVSLAGMQDCKLATDRQLDTWHNYVNRIDRDALLLPEVIIENITVHSANLLKPIFEAVCKTTAWETLYGYAKDRHKQLIFPGKNFAAEQVKRR